MPAKSAPSHLSRRERQILDILYQRGSAGVAEIQAGLPQTPSYSAVRALVRILEEKGHVNHEERDGRYVYAPTISREKASRSAVTPDPELAQAAINAVRQWRYEPALLNGQPIETATTITVNFQLGP